EQLSAWDGERAVPHESYRGVFDRERLRVITCLWWWIGGSRRSKPGWRVRHELPRARANLRALQSREPDEDVHSPAELLDGAPLRRPGGHRAARIRRAPGPLVHGLSERHLAGRCLCHEPAVSRLRVGASVCGEHRRAGVAQRAACRRAVWRMAAETRSLRRPGIRRRPVEQCQTGGGLVWPSSSGRRADDRLDRRLGRSWWRDARQAHALRGTVRPLLATVGDSEARALVMTQLDHKRRQVLARGTVIPAHPLALTAGRRLDERRQRALTRYYIAAGAGGLAVGVHTTQFAIHDPRI